MSQGEKEKPVTHRRAGGRLAQGGGSDTTREMMRFWQEERSRNRARMLSLPVDDASLTKKQVRTPPCHFLLLALKSQP